MHDAQGGKIFIVLRIGIGQIIDLFRSTPCIAIFASDETLVSLTFDDGPVFVGNDFRTFAIKMNPIQRKM